MPNYYPCSRFVLTSDPKEVGKQSVYDLELPGLLSFKPIRRVINLNTGRGAAGSDV